MVASDARHSLFGMPWKHKEGDRETWVSSGKPRAVAEAGGPEGETSTPLTKSVTSRNFLVESEKAQCPLARKIPSRIITQRNSLPAVTKELQGKAWQGIPC